MKLSNGKDLRLYYEEEVDEYTVDYRHDFRDEDGYMVLDNYECEKFYSKEKAEEFAERLENYRPSYGYSDSSYSHVRVCSPVKVTKKTPVKWKDAIADLDEVLNTLGYKIVKKEENE